MVEVEPDGYEPDQVNKEYPDVSESLVENGIRVVRRFCTHEFLELHLCPEVGEVEEDQAEDYDTEDEHVLCGP